MLEEKLCQIGLTANEAKVYLEMLRIGPQGASVIAKRSALNRTTTYSILKELAKKGIVSSCVEARCKLFQANDPNALVGYLDRQSKTYEYYKGEILTVIPQLREMTGHYHFKGPVAKYYDGIAGVKYVIQDTLSAKGEILAYLALDRWLKTGLKGYRDLPILKRNVPLRAVVMDTPETHSFLSENHDPENSMTKILYVKPEQNSGFFENEINIYDDKVAIIHLEKGAEYALLIESKEVAMTQRAIFELAWKGFQER